MSETVNENDFFVATSYVRENTDKFGNEQLLTLYGAFKQAHDGPCNVAKPGFFDFKAKQKWEAWKKLGDMSKAEAMTIYVNTVSEAQPEWHAEAAKLDSGGRGGGGGLGISVSKMSRDDEDVEPCDEEKSVFDWCKDGNVEKLNQHIHTHNVDINVVDEEGLTLLHWAADRGHLEIVSLLLQNNVTVNLKDCDGQTALHYASACSHTDVVEALVSHGIDISVEDNDGLTAAQVAEDSHIKRIINDSKLESKHVDDGFVMVKSKRKKKLKKTEKLPSYLDISSAPLSITDVNELQRAQLKCKQELQCSNYQTKFVSTCKQCILKINNSKGKELTYNHMRIICYGLGTISSSLIARYQLESLISLREALSTDYTIRDIAAYDPLFTTLDESYMQSQGITVLTDNNEGCRPVGTDSITMFYMPHCGRPLYNNLLWSNWSTEQLSRLVIIGNSFTTMDHNVPARVLEAEAKYVATVLPYCYETRVDNSFMHSDVFNDTAVHVFPEEQLSAAKDAVWENARRPTYADNVEIIMNT